MSVSYLAHHGIRGQKWGVRRFQNPDGTLTEAGKRRYTNYDGSLSSEGKKAFFKGKSSNLSQQGNDVIRGYGKDSDIGKEVRSEQFERKYNEHMVDSYGRAADVMNDKVLRDINEKYKDYDEMPREYFEDVGKAWKETYKNVLLKDFGQHPKNGEEWVKDAWGYDMYDDVDFWSQ